VSARSALETPTAMRRRPHAVATSFPSQKSRKCRAVFGDDPAFISANPRGVRSARPTIKSAEHGGYGVGGRPFPQRGRRLVVPPAHLPRMRSAMTSQACALASSSARSLAAEIVRAISRHFSANSRYSSTVLFCWNLGLIGMMMRGWPCCSSQSRSQDTGRRGLFLT
jgi:hypothetical protein